ncbi:pirin family protein [Undibacterium sp. CY7W]|uniref:Pirin family protein n=1 Tax=Undibacterium rugosum TaxID=2762291 RepID=A0A923I386_9BURK|nr:pirin family protein [Undibacterium rugosum]MBC3936953.1 pirin family protein [Undibacterium rugosum]
MNTNYQAEVVNRPRQVEHLVVGQATSDGAGVKLTRLLDHQLQKRLDPFLMLDAFGSDEPDDYIAGFPDHPHRGFETITYMLTGRMRHRDSAGNEGLLQTGGVQWMTAGRGVIHSELPEQESGRMAGFQLWLNLPAQDKMCVPWYRDIQREQIPELRTGQDVLVRVIAGASHGVTGAVQRAHTQPLYLDIHSPDGASYTQTLPATMNAFVVVYEGALQVRGTRVTAGQMAILNNAPESDGVQFQAVGATRAILVAGQPLHEAIVQYGPFVMNSQQEIMQAIDDYRRGAFAA